ncbi:PP2C family protein-serine/threonine phosphatase [Streptomyces niveiscabiei]|uniref:PP2C family protein-serine/threonine phosphatase n=1 Tax=Streptomyces niveiscabiei TaxID=164115 RepID=UPI0029A75D26|nr:PP2C family protein-serine/threonine phosphatase [Streptomyces niveiscabiei]MDX3382792.1 PP2C family protein-serine/threonine phosphatase [Streptomyces niveiscabiei]
MRLGLFGVRGRRVTWLVPALLLTGITLLDVGTDVRFHIESFCVFVVAITAVLCGVRTTALFAVLSLAAFVLTELREPDQYKAGTVDLVLVAVGGGLSVLACAARLRAERRMVRMTDAADTTRRTVLRPLPADWGGLRHAEVYLAADADARVGGDFYDIQPGPHGTRVLVGDVQGKGLAAVEAAAALLGTFREAGYHEADLGVVGARLETRMLRHRAHAAAVGRDEGDRFATAVLLGYPPKGAVGGVAVVEVVLFGHEPPMVVGTGGVRVLGDEAGGGLPLGLGDLGELGVSGDLGDLRGTPEVLRVEVGEEETVLLVTDGVTEARDAQGRFYPLPEELSKALTRDAGLAEPDRLVAFVREGALRHSGGRPGDDTTVFAVRMVPGG